MKTLLRLALIVAGCLIPLAMTSAQNYSLKQTLRPQASGEGRPNTQLGWRIDVDGDIAVIGDLLLDAQGGVLNRTLLRGYRRVAGVLQRAPDLDLQDNSGALVEVALSGTRIAYTTRNAGNTSRRVSVHSFGTNGWALDINRTTNNSAYGNALAVDDDRVVISDSSFNSGQGRVTVLSRANTGVWSSVFLTPSTAQANASFGAAVAIVAGAVVVGAPAEDVGSGPILADAGAAYVFELTMTTWNQVNRLTASTPQAQARFGAQVAISGLDPSTPDRMLIAAPNEQADTGAVYGFRRGASNWTATFRLSDAQAGQRYGNGLALDGAYAAIGADLYDINASLSNAGAVYGVTFNAGFTATAAVQRRSAPQPRASQAIGGLIALDRNGPATFVSDFRADLYGNILQGEVLLSQGNGVEPFPVLVRALDIGQGLTDARYGSMSVDGDALLIGAGNEDVGTLQNLGAVYFHRRQPDGLYLLEQRIASPDAAAGDQFGAVVAISGDIALVGAAFFDSQFGTDTGKVYVYRRNAGIWQLESQLLTNCQNFDRRNFGRALAFNGTSALIGEICNDGDGRADEGDVSTRQANTSWQRQRFGVAIRMSRGAWDADLAIVGTPSSIGAPDIYSEGELSTYRRDVGDGEWYPGRPDVMGQMPDQGFGLDVSDDNGLLAVTSVANNVPVKLYRRGFAQWLPEANLIADAGNVGPTTSVAVRGNRVAVGVPGYAGNSSNEGAVYLYSNPNNLWTQQQQLRSPNIETSCFFGSEIAMHPDGSVFVAAKEEDADFVNEGAVHVFAPPSELLLRDGFE
ncbi:MAG: hypothetical protein SGI99_18540 [Pseudomonadota bacterium]|nr:hypothetical protein [Pseudomonadota bacterium]